MTYRSDANIENLSGGGKFYSTIHAVDLWHLIGLQSQTTDGVDYADGVFTGIGSGALNSQPASEWVDFEITSDTGYAGLAFYPIQGEEVQCAFSFSHESAAGKGATLTLNFYETDNTTSDGKKLQIRFPFDDNTNNDCNVLGVRTILNNTTVTGTESTYDLSAGAFGALVKNRKYNIVITIAPNGKNADVTIKLKDTTGTQNSGNWFTVPAITQTLDHATEGHKMGQSGYVSIFCNEGFGTTSAGNKGIIRISDRFYIDNVFISTERGV